MDEGGDCGLRMRPSERGHVLAHPELHGLGGDGSDVGDEIAPALVAIDEIASNLGNRAKPNAENDKVEVGADAQSAGGGFAAFPMRFEITAFGAHLGAAGELSEVGLCGPAWQAADVDQRLIFGAVASEGLDVEV